MLLEAQQPDSLTSISDLIQSSDVYDCFDNNILEVEFMLDYLTARCMTPKQIYREVSPKPSAVLRVTPHPYLDCDTHSSSAPRLPTVDRDGHLC